MLGLIISPGLPIYGGNVTHGLLDLSLDAINDSANRIVDDLLIATLAEVPEALCDHILEMLYNDTLPSTVK